MKGIQVVSKQQHHVMLETHEHTLQVSEDAVIIVELSLDHIQDIWRQNQQLLIDYKQQKIAIDDFFSGTYAQDLILKDPEHGLFLAQVTHESDNSLSHIKFVKVDSYSDLLYSDVVEIDRLSQIQNTVQEEALQQTVFNMSKAIATVGVESNMIEIKEIMNDADNVYAVLNLLNSPEKLDSDFVLNPSLSYSTNLNIDDLLMDSPNLFTLESEATTHIAEAHQYIQAFSSQGERIDLIEPYNIII